MNEKDKKEEKPEPKPKPIINQDRKPTAENGYEELV